MDYDTDYSMLSYGNSTNTKLDFSILPIIHARDGYGHYWLYVGIRFRNEFDELERIIFKAGKKRLLVKVENMDFERKSLVDKRPLVYGNEGQADRYLIPVSEEIIQTITNEFRNQEFSVALYTKSGAFEIPVKAKVLNSFINLENYRNKYLKNIDFKTGLKDFYPNVPYTNDNLLKLVKNN